MQTSEFIYLEALALFIIVACDTPPPLLADKSAEAQQAESKAGLQIDKNRRESHDCRLPRGSLQARFTNPNLNK